MRILLSLLTLSFAVAACASADPPPSTNDENVVAPQEAESHPDLMTGIKCPIGMGGCGTHLCCKAGYTCCALSGGGYVCSSDGC